MNLEVLPHDFEPFGLQPGNTDFLMCSHPTRPSCNCRKRQEGGVNETNSVPTYLLCHQVENGVMEMPHSDSIFIL